MYVCAAGMSFCLPLAFWQENKRKKAMRDIDGPLLGQSQVSPQTPGAHALSAFHTHRGACVDDFKQPLKEPQPQVP